MSAEQTNPPDKEEAVLRERMMHAAVLPENHPLRVEMASEIAARGERAAQLWNDVLHEDSQLRAAMHEVPVPTTLEPRLNEIPESPAPVPLATKRPWMSKRWILPTAVAAAIMIGIGIWGAAGRRAAPPAHHGSVIPLVAAIDPLPQNPTVAVTDWAQVQNQFASKLPFDLVAPPMNRPMTLVGAGISMMKGKFPALHTVWTDGTFQYHLFQFDAANLGIQGPIERIVMCPKFALGQAMQNCRIVLWSDDGHDFALLVNPGDKPTPPLPV